MEREKFMNKVRCEFAVITHDLDCKIITKELSLEPDRYFNKGDKFTSKYSSRVGSYPYGLWAIGSQPVISDELNVSDHIKYFQELLEGKIEVIEGFKKNYQFECVFSVDIKTEDTGTRFDLNELELSFIARIASRYGCAFINKEIEAQSSN
jgi:Domain of unknown function (DUF4279)